MKKSESNTFNCYDHATRLMREAGEPDVFDPHKRFKLALGDILKAKERVETTEEQAAHIPLKQWPHQRRKVSGFWTPKAATTKFKKLMREGWTKIWFIQIREGHEVWTTWNGGEKAYTCRTDARRDAIALSCDGPDTRIVRWTHQKRKDLQWAYWRVRVFRIQRRDKQKRLNQIPEEIREWRKASAKLAELKAYLQNLNRSQLRGGASKRDLTLRT